MNYTNASEGRVTKLALRKEGRHSMNWNDIGKYKQKYCIKTIQYVKGDGVSSGYTRE